MMKHTFLLSFVLLHTPFVISVSTNEALPHTTIHQNEIVDLIGDRTIDQVLTIKDPVALKFIFPPTLSKSTAPASVRYTYIVLTVFYHVLAACHPTALSFFGTKDEIPKVLCQPIPKAIILGFMLHRCIRVENPIEAATLARLISAFNVNVTNDSMNVSVPAGWANVQAARFLKYLGTDGWNSLGDENQEFFRHRFADTTGYKPINHADLHPFQLKRPLRWQPLRRDNGRGQFTSQVHIFPHIGLRAKPLVITRSDLDARQAPPPYKTPNRKQNLGYLDRIEMQRLIDEVLNISRGLTLEQIILAYWWENKALSIGSIVPFYVQALGLDEFMTIRLMLGGAMAQHDAVILSWKEKRRHDLVRPSTMIRRLRKGRREKSFVHEAMGVKVVNMSEWEPLIPEQPHSEYPSASAVLCTATLDHLKKGLKEIVGSLKTAPRLKLDIPNGYVPRVFLEKPFTVSFKSIGDMKKSCGMSRLYAGVHFSPSISAGNEIAKGLGGAAFRHMKDLVSGKVPRNCERCGKY